MDEPVDPERVGIGRVGEAEAEPEHARDCQNPVERYDPDQPFCKEVIGIVPRDVDHDEPADHEEDRNSHQVRVGIGNANIRVVDHDAKRREPTQELQVCDHPNMKQLEMSQKKTETRQLLGLFSPFGGAGGTG
jgi:hypothetical protein